MESTKAFLRTSLLISIVDPPTPTRPVASAFPQVWSPGCDLINPRSWKRSLAQMAQAVMVTMADASQASVTLAGHDAHIDMISSHFQVPVTWVLKYNLSMSNLRLGDSENQICKLRIISTTLWTPNSRLCNYIFCLLACQNRHI